jgi:hypothetical protein
MTDDDERLSPTDLEQLARSLAMDGSLGQHDSQAAAAALRELARIDPLAVTDGAEGQVPLSRASMTASSQPAMPSEPTTEGGPPKTRVGRC